MNNNKSDKYLRLDFLLRILMSLFVNNLYLSMDEFIQEFVHITDATTEQAIQYYEISNHDINSAVMLFLENNQIEEGADLQQGKSTDNFISTSDRQGSSSTSNANIIENQVRNNNISESFHSLSRTHDTNRGANILNNNPFSYQPNNENSSDKLANMFAPPSKLFFKGTFDQARTEGIKEFKWILVTIHDPLEFPCQMLNRDVWKDKDVEELVKENFLFFQWMVSSEEAQKYKTFYRFFSFPHIAFIDPRTGERVKVWDHFISAIDFIQESLDFLDENTLDSMPKRNRADSVHSEDEDLKKALKLSEEQAVGSGLIPVERLDPVEGDITSLQFRFPNGSRVVKKFLKSDSLLDVFQHLKFSCEELKNRPFEVSLQIIYKAFPFA